MQRYEWEDALIQAQADGVISNGALLVCLKLASNINWSPQDGRAPGLYWKNEEALKDAGAGRSTYFKHRKSLLETGFIAQVNGNLLPTLPEKSTVETSTASQKSTVETMESTVETEKSTGEHPFSEDIFSEDSFSEGGRVFNDPPSSLEDTVAIFLLDNISIERLNEDAGQSTVETFGDLIIRLQKEHCISRGYAEELARLSETDPVKYQKEIDFLEGAW